jgi:hypothetical protein
MRLASPGLFPPDVQNLPNDGPAAEIGSFSSPMDENLTIFAASRAIVRF